MKIGKNTVVYHQHLSNILEGCVIGDNCTIHSQVWIGNVTIGNNCKIQAFAFIPKGVTIGNDVFIGPHVCFTNDKYPPSKGKGWETTVVEDYVMIGANVTILPGVTLGEGCAIGAGAVVTKSVPPREVWIGNPARKPFGTDDREEYTEIDKANASQPGCSFC